jgi:hypothetical protein
MERTYDGIGKEVLNQDGARWEALVERAVIL